MPPTAASRASIDRATASRAARTGRMPADRSAADASRAAADRSFADTAARLAAGLEKTLDGFAASADPARRKIAALWLETKAR